jgi:hypothetical protein
MAASAVSVVTILAAIGKYATLKVHKITNYQRQQMQYNIYCVF